MDVIDPIFLAPTELQSSKLLFSCMVEKEVEPVVWKAIQSICTGNKKSELISIVLAVTIVLTSERTMPSQKLIPRFLKISVTSILKHWPDQLCPLIQVKSPATLPILWYSYVLLIGTPPFICWTLKIIEKPLICECLYVSCIKVWYLHSSWITRVRTWDEFRFTKGNRAL